MIFHRIRPLHIRLLLGLGAMLTTFLLPSCADPYVRALDNGVLFLESMQRPDGAICDSVNPLFETWETVEAATALYAYYQDTAVPSVNAALRFLRSQENAAGMLCHNIQCREAYCLETTAEYFILLRAIHGPDFLKQRVDTLKRLQLPSGEWRIGNPDVLQDQAFPSVTAFVLGALQAAEVAPLSRDSAYAWLGARQDSTGGWGQSWEYYGTEAYALWPALRALRGFRHRKTPNMLVNAEAKLVACFDSAMQRNDSDAAGAQRISKELEVGLTLVPLLESDDRATHSQARYGLKWLLDRQRPDGSWNGGRFPIPKANYVKEEYLFATARIVLALVIYLEQHGS